VATSELADPTPYLEGGEVLLTTGLETGDWRAEWRPYVERLAAVGVAELELGHGHQIGEAHHVQHPCTGRSAILCRSVMAVRAHGS
jgi:hypothetical protein